MQRKHKQTGEKEGSQHKPINSKPLRVQICTYFTCAPFSLNLRALLRSLFLHVCVHMRMHACMHACMPVQSRKDRPKRKWNPEERGQLRESGNRIWEETWTVNRRAQTFLESQTESRERKVVWSNLRFVVFGCGNLPTTGVNLARPPLNSWPCSFRKKT